MANTISAPASGLGDSFDVVTLDSARVHTVDVGSETVTHTLGSKTTLIIVYVPSTAADGVLVVRGEEFDVDHAWPMLPGYHPFGVVGGSRDLHLQAADAVAIKIQEN